MPELPEVESMRKILLTLKSPAGAKKKDQRLQIQRVKDNPPKVFVSDEEIALLNDNCTVLDVTRKGKLLCMILECIKPISVPNKGGKEDDGKPRTTTTTKKVYLFAHMGMTGRISSPTCIPNLQELKDTTDYPLPNTYLNFTLVDQTTQKTVAEASFSDPRKFGAVDLDVSLQRFDELAPDAFLELKGELRDGIVDKLTEQSKPIKAILLDQKRVVSGVGNWIADEVCYQCQLHPEQKYLTRDEAQKLVATLSVILETAVACNANADDFPKDWMFHCRWERKRDEAKDSKGRKITFVKSGGRTSAIVAAIQKEQGRSKTASATKKKKVAAETTQKEVKKEASKGKVTGKEGSIKTTNNTIKREAPEEDDKKEPAPVKSLKSKRKLADTDDVKVGPIKPTRNGVKRQSQNPVPDEARRYPRRSTRAS